MNLAPTNSQLPSPLVYPLADNARLIEILAEILDKPAKEVRRLLHEEEQALGTYLVQDFQAWGLEPHVWHDRLVEFYRQSHAGLIGNPVWNRRTEKLRMRSWVGRYLAREGPARLDILMVGDGSGFDSLYLAQCGHQVTYAEEAATSRAFARRIFTDTGLAVRVCQALAEATDQTYDVIVCLDVLEHVPDPPALVAQFARLLRPGGRLIVHAPFFFVTWHNPTHLRANRRFSGDLCRLYLANGLELLDGNLFWDPLVLYQPAPPPQTRSSRWPRRLLLRLGGLLLMVARWWNWPHNRLAVRAMQKADPKWLQGLEP